ncbi:MAG: hypothetical protein Q7R93_02290 [bacterium]|nr:hypothetical protein [bacterium]
MKQQTTRKAKKVIAERRRKRLNRRPKIGLSAASRNLPRIRCELTSADLGPGRLS